MESPVLKLKKKKSPNLYILQKTKTIQEEDIVPHAEWEIIKNWYRDIEKHPDVEWIDKAMNSVINSIVHQRRAVFAISRDGIRDILTNDKNWLEPIGLKNERYEFLLASLVEAGIIENVRERQHKKLSIYKVVSQDILEMIKVASPEEQLREVIDFVDKNDDIDEGTQEGTQKGTQKDRKLESKKDSLNRSDSPLNSSKVTFEQLLFAQHPDSFPSFDEVTYLAQLAVENCDLVEVDTYTMRTLEKHLKSLCKNKPTPKQKAWIDKIMGAFEFEANKNINLKQVQNIDLKEPIELQSKALKKAVDDDAAIQNNTLNILKATFGKEKIVNLKRKIERSQDVNEKNVLQQELEYWQNIL